MNLTEALNALEQAKKEKVEVMQQLEELTHKHAELITAHSDLCLRYAVEFDASGKNAQRYAFDKLSEVKK